METLSMSNSGLISSGTTLWLKGQSVRLINGLNQSIISFNSTGILLERAVNMNSNSISSLTDLTASGNASSSTTTTNTLTTVGVELNIKSDLVLLQGSGNSMYMDAHPGGVVCRTDFYMCGMLKNRSVFTIGDQTGVNAWTSQCSISDTGIYHH